jgi:hypothetical protein
MLLQFLEPLQNTSLPSATRWQETATPTTARRDHREDSALRRSYQQETVTMAGAGSKLKMQRVRETTGMVDAAFCFVL